jgi:hypothetical protein
MAGNLGDDFSNDLLDYIFGGVALTSDADLEFALYTVSPGDDDTGTEVNTGVWTNYAREVMVRNQTNWPAAAARTIDNGVALDFGTAAITGTPPEVVAVAARDAGSDQLRAFAILNTSKTINDGDPVDFAIGDLDWTFVASA